MGNVTYIFVCVEFDCILMDLHMPICTSYMPCLLRNEMLIGAYLYSGR